MRINYFNKQVRKTATCWFWQGKLDKGGYGVYSSHPAHRASYRFFIGSIPAGLVIDHLCGIRNCVNPKHLEAVTQRENIHRSINSGNRKQKSACKWDHPYDEANTYVSANGRRNCRACNKAAVSRYEERSTS